VFTSGATEWNEKNTLFAAQKGKVDHQCHPNIPSVREAAKGWRGAGRCRVEIPADAQGVVQAAALRGAIAGTWADAGLDHACQQRERCAPALGQLLAICREKGISFHTDADAMAGQDRPPRC